MPTGLAEIARAALELPPEQRRALARMLLEVSEEGPVNDATLGAAWEEEVIRRLQAAEEGPEQPHPDEDPFADLDRRSVR